MKKYNLLFAMLLLFQQLSFSQDQQKIDSLQAELKKLQAKKKELGISISAMNDTLTANILYELSKAYWYYDSTKAMDYANQTLALSEQIGFKKGIGNAINSMGFINFASYHYLTAHELYKKSLKIREEINDRQGIGGSYHNIANIYTEQGNYADAMKNYFAALKILEEIGDTHHVALTTRNIGYIYSQQGNFPEALKNYLAALKILIQVGDKVYIAETYFSMSGINHKQKNFKEAKKNTIAALKIFRELGDKGGIARCFDNFGVLDYSQGNYAEATKNFLMVSKMAEEREDKLFMAQTYTTLGEIYIRQNKLNDASRYMNKSISLAKEVGRMETIKDSYEIWAMLDSAQNNFKQALVHYKLYIVYRDSLFNEENTKKLVQSQMQYEFDKKEALTKAEQEVKDIAQKAELSKQKQQKYYFITGGILLLLIAFILVNRLRFARKTRIQLEEKNKIIAAEKERAEQSEKFKQQFLANMSHEIRSPMNAVMGMTNLLIDKNPRSEHFHYLDGIKKSSETLLHIINDILDVSKIEAGKIELEHIDFSIHEVVEQVKQMLQHKANESGIQLITDINSNVPEVVIGDPVRLNQVLMNLAGNAIKFTEKGSVTVEVAHGKEGIKFSIIDTGVGIPKDKIQSVFESFTQAHSSDTRKFGGTGLGLTISKQLVELMGGKLSIESEPGSGSTFSFEINYPAGSAERMQQQKSSEQIDGSILNGLKILLTDDNDYNRIVARDTLTSKANVEIIEALNGEDALEKLNQNDFDLVLMDVQMPVMDGYEATRNIREKFATPKNQIPVIALTSSVIRRDLDKCRQAGMTDYIPKPFKTSQLISAIAKATGREIKFLEKNNVELDNNAETNNWVIDLSYLEEFCEGDNERIKKYINIFLQSSPLLTEKLNAALKENNFEDIASRVHGFKTKCIMMGMDDAKELAVSIEYQCRKETPLCCYLEITDRKAKPCPVRQGA